MPRDDFGPRKKRNRAIDKIVRGAEYFRSSPADIHHSQRGAAAVALGSVLYAGVSMLVEMGQGKNKDLYFVMKDLAELPAFIREIRLPRSSVKRVGAGDVKNAVLLLDYSQAVPDEKVLHDAGGIKITHVGASARLTGKSGFTLIRAEDLVKAFCKKAATYGHPEYIERAGAFADEVKACAQQRNIPVSLSSDNQRNV